MEHLVEIPVDKWPILQDRLQDMWPLNIAGFYALYQNIKHPKVREAFQFKVYSPLGNIENGFVATSLKGTPDIILFSTSKDTSRLEEALLSTKLIDWNQHTCIDLVSSLILQAWENKVQPALKPSHCKIGKVRTYVLSRCTLPFSLRLPSNTYLAPLNEDNIQRVDETWPYKHAASHFYFTTLAMNGLAQGLYSIDNNNLLAWVFLNEYNFICHLYCEEEHRQKGYAEYLLKCLVNDQLGQGNDIYTYVEDANEISSRLFDKLGFVNVDDGAYIFVRK